MIKFYTVSFYANSFPALYEWTLLYFIFCGSMGWDGMSFIVFYVMWCVMSYASSFIVMAWMLVIWFWFFTGIVCIVRMDGWMDTCGGCENIRIYKFHIIAKCYDICRYGHYQSITHFISYHTMLLCSDAQSRNRKSEVGVCITL